MVISKALLNQIIRTSARSFKHIRRKRKMGSRLEELLGGIENGNSWRGTYGGGIKVTESFPKLEAGFYRAEIEPHEGVTLKKAEFKGDDYIVLENDPTRRVVDEIKNFWNMKEKYNQMGFIWKRGVLLYGPPGTGKSTTIRVLMEFFIQADGIVISSSAVENIIATCVAIRGPEKKRPILAILEDLDSFTDTDSLEALLQFLDGNFQLENIVIIATTNYPERLEDRVINRPGRFDLLVEMPLPTQKDRESFLKNKISDKEKVKRFLQKTNGFSIAHLKELVCATELLNENEDTAIQRIREMINKRYVHKSNKGDDGPGYI